MDTLFFVASKLVWPLLSPGTWLLLLPLLAYVVNFLGSRRLAGFLWAIEIVCVVIIGFCPVGQWLARPLEEYRSSLPSGTSSPDGIIVLGGAWQLRQSEYWGQLEMNSAAERDIYMAMLARRFPNAQLVFTGGNNRLSGEGLSEADLARTFYDQLGIDADRMIFESESRNTYENALNSKRLVQPEEDEEWWLVTSAYHMPRSRGVFCQAGWNVKAYPVDHLSWGRSYPFGWSFVYHLGDLEYVLHEWLGLLVYRITGKTSALFPDENCN